MPVDDFILAVDLDGVCADYTKALRQVLEREHSIGSPHLPPDFDPHNLPEAPTWNFENWGLTLPQYTALHDLAVRDYRIMRDMEMIEGCADALWRLSDAGAWIRLVTHRIYTNWGHNVVVRDTSEWLDKHQVPYRDLCFLSAKASVASHAAIDDAPHQVLKLREAGRHVIVFDAPHNQEVEGPRAYGWAEVEAQVMTLLTEHYGNVEQALPGVGSGGERLGGHSTAGG